MSESLGNVSSLVEQFLSHKKEIEKIEKEQISPLNEKILQIQSKLIAEFEASGLSKFSSAVGSVHLMVEKKVKMPQGDDKITFVNFLKARGEWDTFASIHHATLNSWFNENMDTDPLFVAPGLGLPSENKYLKRGR